MPNFFYFFLQAVRDQGDNCLLVPQFSYGFVCPQDVFGQNWLSGGIGYAWTTDATRHKKRVEYGSGKISVDTTQDTKSRIACIYN